MSDLTQRDIEILSVNADTKAVFEHIVLLLQDYETTILTKLDKDDSTQLRAAWDYIYELEQRLRGLRVKIHEVKYGEQEIPDWAQ